MKLEQLRIANFKSIQRPATLDFKNLTFLYGPNSAGKSAVLDALDFLASIGSGKLSPRRVAALTNSLGKKQHEGIKLGVTVYIDALSFEYIGNVQFDELERTLDVLTDGAHLSFDIEFEADTDTGHVAALSIGIDGEEILNYKNQTTRLGPELKLLNDDQTEVGQVKTILGLDGEWRINAQHGVSDDVLIDPAGQSVRSRLAFSHDGEAIRIIRGISYSDGSDLLAPLLSAPEISASSLQFILPQNPNDIVSDPDSRSSLYRASNIFDSYSTEPHAKEIYSHRSFLGSYGWGPEAISNYPEFLRSEFSAENSARLYSDLKEQREKIERFLSSVLTTIANSINIPRVPGSRNAFDSQQPIHIKSRQARYSEYFDAELPEKLAVRTGRPLKQPDDFSPLHHSSQRLTPDTGGLSLIMERLISPYAMQIANGIGGGKNSPEDSDFPNFVLDTYLHSLGKYQIDPRVYCLTLKDMQGAEDSADSEDMQDAGDPTGLANSRLVYFSLSTNTGEHLSFSDVGSALGYIFPTLAALGEFPALAIEQPELHLHPLAQDQLADVFVHAANTAKEFPRRIIIESHSEVFLLRVSQRIAHAYRQKQAAGENVTSHSPKLDLDWDQVKIYYFMPEKDGATSVEEIPFASNGTLVNSWPSGMFASDWTSGIDRLNLFSKSYRIEDAQKKLPWLYELRDETTKDWLRIAVQLESLGEDMLENCVVIWGKVAERVLKEVILDPMLITLRVSRHKLSDHDKNLENDLFGKFRRKDRAPTLGWWAMTLDRVKNRKEGEPTYVRVLRSHMKNEEFQFFWSGDPASDLAHFIKLLREVRNPSAHAGNADRSKMIRARDLIARGTQPGILFESLGLISKKRQGLNEVK